MDDFVVLEGELSGFGLAAWRHKNGVIQLLGGKDRHIGTTWPDEITLLGNTYTLEEVIKGSVRQEDGAIFENAEYV